jgi:hypothetical protein
VKHARSLDGLDSAVISPGTPISDLVTVSFTSGVRVGLRHFSISESGEGWLDVKEPKHSSEESAEGSSYEQDKKHRSGSHPRPRYEGNEYVIVMDSHEVTAHPPSLLSGQ